ncbi:hypothetical protein HAX54_017428 [Datura stramonium]|uniref:Uncharacterized protein n=1 Tax=Datura stramonium TaxID=4076 RepID=A0ABS8UKX8_DATST|nr:hypothetical protein [Datura stramonium]
MNPYLRVPGIIYGDLVFLVRSTSFQANSTVEQMASPLISTRRYWAFFIYVVLKLHASNALYLPGSHMHTDQQGEEILVKVNSLIFRLKLNFRSAISSLPYCKPETDKSKTSGFEIAGFEVVPCSVKYDPEKMTKLHMYDNTTSISCPLELEKSQIIREQEKRYP